MRNSEKCHFICLNKNFSANEKHPLLYIEHPTIQELGCLGSMLALLILFACLGLSVLPSILVFPSRAFYKNVGDTVRNSIRVDLDLMLTC